MKSSSKRVANHNYITGHSFLKRERETNYTTSTITFGLDTTSLQPSVGYSNLRKMQVCPAMQIFSET